jgi:hypothetical protein
VKGALMIALALGPLACGGQSPPPRRADYQLEEGRHRALRRRRRSRHGQPGGAARRGAPDGHAQHRELSRYFFSR